VVLAWEQLPQITAVIQLFPLLHQRAVVAELHRLIQTTLAMAVQAVAEQEVQAQQIPAEAETRLQQAHRKVTMAALDR
jgi:hypothetical protein